MPDQTWTRAEWRAWHRQRPHRNACRLGLLPRNRAGLLRYSYAACLNMAGECRRNGDRNEAWACLRDIAASRAGR